MGRTCLILGLVILLMATGVAVASPADEVRLPFRREPPIAPVNFIEVARGDHLWKISAHHLASESADTDVAPYWRRVIEVNRPTLRSGDPDLIFPGELIELPEISEQR